MFTQGTANADVLNGGAGDDTLYGAGGADKLTGNAGHDLLTGDAGNDTLLGGAGEDYLMGGAGNDSLDGGADADWASYEDATAAVKVDLNLTTAQNTLGGGTDTLKAIENLHGSAFNDTLIGNAASNYLHGGAGADSLFGGAGDDHFDGGAGNDTLNGGNGDDVVSYENGIVGGVTLDLNLTTGQANGAHGTDTLISIEAIWGSGYDDRLTGNAADNYLYGGAGADLLKGGDGADVLDGATGNDTIIGGQGADDLTGGAGDDLFQFADGDSGVFNSLGGVAAGTTDTINDFTGGTRGTGAAAGTGDTLDFGLAVGTANNYVENTAATSAAAATQAATAFAANSGLRYVATQVGGDTLVFASDADGGEAHNVVTLKGVGAAGLDFNNIIGTPVITPPAGVITGTFGPDMLIGTGAQETLLGGAGADTIWGGQGNDVLTGGADDDLFKVGPDDSSGAAPDRITDFQGGTRGAGTVVGTGDTLDFGHFAGTATNYIENSAATFEAALTQAGIELSSNNAHRYVATEVGADVIVFASGPDGWAGPYPTNGMQSYVTLQNTTTGAISFNNIVGFTTTSNQVQAGTPGRDVLTGGGGRDLLTGDANNDWLFGDAGKDTLDGGDGQDTLIGGLGADTITGGANEDLFIFAPRDSGDFSFGGAVVFGSADTITDFQTGIDRLTFGEAPAIATQTSGNYVELSTVYTAYSEAEIAAHDTFSARPLLTYVVTQVGADSYVFVDTGGDPDADSIVYLQGVTLSGIAAVDIV